MRSTATALATIVAVLVISGTRPPVSGRSALPPCEVAPQVPTITAPKAPTNLRMIRGVEEFFEDLLVSGPNAGPEVGDDEPAMGATTGSPADPHTYYFALASRPDCFGAYSLRNAVQVEALRAPKLSPVNLRYMYPDDPDPRKQDGAKIIVPEGEQGPGQQLRLPAGPSGGRHVLITLDLWMGREWDKSYSRMEYLKGTPVVIMRHGDVQWAGMRTSFANARLHEHNQPSGGPFVAMMYPHSTGKTGIVKTDQYGGSNWMDGMDGYPRVRLPYTSPYTEQRPSNEGIAPVDTSVSPAGAEAGMVAERWSRVWHYFERVPSEDWVSQHPEYSGQKMNAYRWSFWFADTARAPIRVLNEAIIGIPSTLTNQIQTARLELSSSDDNQATKYSGRGDLIAYTRNWVVLHGVSKSDVLTLLQKPVM